MIVCVRGKEERQERGKKGREWVTSKESGMSANQMCNNIIEAIDSTFDNFVPRSKFDIIQVNDYEPEKVKHKLIGY